MLNNRDAEQLKKVRNASAQVKSCRDKKLRKERVDQRC